MKIILHLPNGSDGILALRAARNLIEHNHNTCIYTFTDGTVVDVRKNKRSVTAYEIPKPYSTAAQDAAA